MLFGTRIRCIWNLIKFLETNWRRCWCDGILFPDNEADYTVEPLRTKQLVTKAWIAEGKIKEVNADNFFTG